MFRSVADLIFATARHATAILRVLAVLAIALVLIACSHARSLDGQTVEAKVYRIGATHPYTLRVTFRSRAAIIWFNNGGYLTLVLRDPSIPDQHNIVGVDTERGDVWQIDVPDQ